MHTGGSMGQEGLDLLPGRFSCPSLEGRLDLLHRLSQRTSILVEENCRRPCRASFRQGQSGRGGDWIGLLLADPLFPGNSLTTAGDENRFDAGNRCLPAMAVEFNRGIGLPVDHDFLAVRTKLTDNDPPGREIGQRTVRCGQPGAGQPRPRPRVLRYEESPRPRGPAG